MAKNSSVLNVRAALPWVEQRRPVHFLALYFLFLIGVARVAYTRPPRRSPAEPTALWVTPGRGGVAALAAALLAAFVIHPVLKLGSDWRGGTSFVNFDFVEWFVIQVVIAIVAAAYGMAVFGQRAPRALVAYGAAFIGVLWIAALASPIKLPWFLIVSFSPLLLGEVFSRIRRARA